MKNLIKEIVLKKDEKPWTAEDAVRAEMTAANTPGITAIHWVNMYGKKTISYIYFRAPFFCPDNFAYGKFMKHPVSLVEAGIFNIVAIADNETIAKWEWSPVRATIYITGRVTIEEGQRLPRVAFLAGDKVTASILIDFVDQHAHQIRPNRGEFLECGWVARR
jgi:hypothetical protein